jgi:hypothetical protein
MSPSSVRGRFLFYREYGFPEGFLGRVGYQKRIRKLVRFVAYPSPIHIAVWQECYWRWRALSESVLDAHPDILEESEKNYHTLSYEVPSPRFSRFLLGNDHFLAQEKHHQWRNLTLFLAAFGGACVHDDQDILPLTAVIPTQYLPDEMRVTQESIARVTLDSGALVESFVTDLTDLLVVDSMQVREVAREALGSELNPRLYSRLVRHLDEFVHLVWSMSSLLNVIPGSSAA